MSAQKIGWRKHILEYATFLLYETIDKIWCPGIHPFADGNGRVARLIHSWILLKAGLPMFIFNPEKRNTYFMLLESARDKSIEEFIDFCISEHRSSLEKLMCNWVYILVITSSDKHHFEVNLHNILSITTLLRFCKKNKTNILMWCNATNSY